LGIKFFSFFIIFFFLSSVFIIYQKEKTLKPDKNQAKALMEFKDIKTYNITYSGIDGKLQAKSAKRYKYKDVFYGIHSSRNNINAKEQLWANKGILENNILNLFGNVLYKSDLNRTLSSNTVTYNLKKDILSSKTAFKSTFDNSTLVGSSFIYYKKQKRLIAKNIKAQIHTEK